MVSTKPRYKDSPWMALERDQSRWLGSAPLLDMDDTKMRLKVQSLTQLKRTDLQRAVAIYGYVKTLPFRQPGRYAVKSARAVLEDGRGGWFAKSTLLVAMMRLAGIPSRLRVLALDGETLRGLVDSSRPFILPVVEFWINDRWVKTDTHIFDPRTMNALRQALMRKGWSRGYGLHRLGQSLWDGREDAYASFALDQRDGTPCEDYGVYNDVSEFSAFLRRTKPHLWAVRMAHYRMIRSRLQKGVARVMAATGSF